MHGCQFVPPYLLSQLAERHPDPRAAERFRSTLVIDERVRTDRSSRAGRPGDRSAPAGQAAWSVHTADHAATLPGPLVRSAGDPAAGDDAVDEAAAGVAASLALFREVYDRASYDGAGAAVLATVHYEQDYDNAFWNGDQLVFGDGDGEVFERFTKPVDVLGHEFTHAVTEHTAGFAYQGQSGALNESVSDCFASCLKQRLLDQTAAEADWLIGEGIFTPSVHGQALRSMAAPGTAYDDPRLGQDPQVGHLDDYVDTEDDNGGVHLNSGIPNQAFQRAAVAIGGATWEGAGRVWYAALTGGRVAPDSDFAGFAAATVAAAGEHAEAVRQAWHDVGVEPAGRASGGAGRAGSSDGSGGSGGSGGVVRVTRSGGFAGVRLDGELDLDLGGEPAAEARALLARIDLAAVAGGLPEPDRFVYAFEVPGAGVARVAEGQLTPELARLAELALLDPE